MTPNCSAHLIFNPPAAHRFDSCQERNILKTVHTWTLGEGRLHTYTEVGAVLMVFLFMESVKTTHSTALNLMENNQRHMCIIHTHTHKKKGSFKRIDLVACYMYYHTKSINPHIIEPMLSKKSPYQLNCATIDHFPPE